MQTTDGKSLAGEVADQGFDDLQLRTDDGQVHLLRRAGDAVREVTSEKDWPGLQRRPRRQPLHDDVADHQGQRRDGWRRSGCSRCPMRRACR